MILEIFVSVVPQILGSFVENACNPNVKRRSRRNRECKFSFTNELASSLKLLLRFTIIGAIDATLYE